MLNAGLDGTVGEPVTVTVTVTEAVVIIVVGP